MAYRDPIAHTMQTPQQTQDSGWATPPSQLARALEPTPPPRDPTTNAHGLSSWGADTAVSGPSLKAVFEDRAMDDFLQPIVGDTTLADDSDPPAVLNSAASHSGGIMTSENALAGMWGASAVAGHEAPGSSSSSSQTPAGTITNGGPSHAEGPIHYPFQNTMWGPHSSDTGSTCPVWDQHETDTYPTSYTDREAEPCPLPAASSTSDTPTFTKTQRKNWKRMLRRGEHVCAIPDCGKRFSRSDALTRHERQHTGEWAFVCRHCGRTFYRKDHLDKHQHTHVQ